MKRENNIFDIYIYIEIIMSKVHYQVTINAPWEKDQPLFQQVGLVTGASQGVGKGISDKKLIDFAQKDLNFLSLHFF